MKRLFLFLPILAILLCNVQTMHAETAEERTTWPNELRLTFSPWLYESLIWHERPHFDYHGAGSDNTVFAENHNFVYTPHMGVDYMRHINSWCSVGVLMDFQYTGWNKVRYNNQDAVTGQSKECFYNLSIVPSVQFTYLWHPNVNLYSAIGLGMDINGGTETNLQGKHTALGAAINITMLGLRVGKGRWYGCAEVGGLYALKNMNAIYMIGARIISVGAGVGF